MAEFNLFDRDSPERESRQAAAFTPCSGLSRMSLNSTRVLPSTSFADKLSQVIEEENTHPNLNMFLNNTNKITMFDSKKKECRISFSSDEEDDDFEFSSNIFFNSKSIFATEMADLDQNGDPFFDRSNAWVFSVYEDSNNRETDFTEEAEEERMMEDNNNNHSYDDDDDDENRPPRIWLREMEQQPKKHSRRVSHDSRSPLKEIEIMFDEDDIHTRKKVAIGNTPKMRIIRTLSPTRDTKRKGKDVDMSN